MNPACYSTNTAGSLSGEKDDEAWSLRLTYLCLQPRVRISGAISIPPYAYMECASKFALKNSCQLDINYQIWIRKLAVGDNVSEPQPLQQRELPGPWQPFCQVDNWLQSEHALKLCAQHSATVNYLSLGSIVGDKCSTRWTACVIIWYTLARDDDNKCEGSLWGIRPSDCSFVVCTQLLWKDVGYLDLHLNCLHRSVYGMLSDSVTRYFIKAALMVFCLPQ